jgi:hypothetical protein
MATTAIPSRNPSAPARASGDLLLLGAPLAALLAGLAAQWLDFNALRYPLLLMVLGGVTATAHALTGGRRGWRPFAVTVATGIATWAAAETLYVVIHAALGQPFDAERFGAQWSQALGLIAVHALALGAPTGICAAVLLQGVALVRARQPQPLQ